MKILYIITKSNYGGAQRYVHELAINMHKDHEVVVAFGGNGGLKDKLEEAGIETRQIQSFQRDINPLKEVRAFFELRRLYKNEKPDIVHLNSSKAGMLGTLVGRVVGIKKIIFTAHGWPFLEPRNIVWRTMAWIGSYITALLSHKVILVSHNDQERTRMPFIKKKCVVIHTAIPNILFKERLIARDFLYDTQTQDLHNNDLWLVSIAELTKNKNLLAAIEAVRIHNKKSNTKIFFTIIGSGELRKEFEDKYEAHKIAGEISFIGYVDDARKYLNAFDAFILPSKKEGLPYAILEAGAAGLPVIASNVGGIPEIIEDAENGLLIDPNDTSTIVAALETLVHNKDTRQKYGSMLKEKIHTDFSLKDMLEKTSKLYTNTL